MSQPNTPALQRLQAEEAERYLAAHPRSQAMAAHAAPHYLFGVPMHWMRDWPLPTPLVVEQAQGASLRCVDGHVYADFCLGDTGAMFGHSPAAVAKAIATQARRGLTAMLPSARSAEVGAALTACFGLPRWQVCLSASDANRFALRWARAITAQPRVLVFDGCYHGTVDDTLVDLQAGEGSAARTVTRASLLGQLHDLSLGTVAVPFNDLPALRAALATGDVACVLAEPALTNCGLVPPLPGYWDQASAMIRAHGALLVMDETHTLSSGWGGWCRAHALVPDMLVIGKAIAGGLPTAVYGFSEAVAERMASAKNAAPEGHSGIGTTLSANLLAMAALQANLTQVMTPAAYAVMEARAATLAGALQALIQDRGLPWTITRLGARMELQFCAHTPRDAAQARAAMHIALERALHLYLLNRGVLITPFHNMVLVSPETTEPQMQALVDGVEAFIGAVFVHGP